MAGRALEVHGSDRVVTYSSIQPSLSFILPGTVRARELETVEIETMSESLTIFSTWEKIDKFNYFRLRILELFPFYGPRES